MPYNHAIVNSNMGNLRELFSSNQYVLVSDFFAEKTILKLLLVFCVLRNVRGDHLVPHRRATLQVQEELPEVEEEPRGLTEEEDEDDKEEDVRVACISAC